VARKSKGVSLAILSRKSVKNGYSQHFCIIYTCTSCFKFFLTMNNEVWFYRIYTHCNFRYMDVYRKCMTSYIHMTLIKNTINLANWVPTSMDIHVDVGIIKILIFSVKHFHMTKYFKNMYWKHIINNLLFVVY
jgi:hypothetical protein